MTRPKMKFEDVKVTGVHTSFFAKFPTQNYGNIEIGRAMNAEVQPGQDAREIEVLLSEHIQTSVREALAPIAKRIYETQIAPMLENLPEAMRKDLESKFGALQALAAISPELRAVVEEK